MNKMKNKIAAALLMIGGYAGINAQEVQSNQSLFTGSPLAPARALAPQAHIFESKVVTVGVMNQIRGRMAL